MSEPHAIRLARAMRHTKARFAHDAEGNTIAQMVHTCHDQIPNVSWSKVAPYWLIAEHQGEIVGCVNVCYTMPIGRLEWMSFVPGLPYKARALSVKALLDLGQQVLKQTGSTAVVGNLGFEQKSFRDILQAEGCNKMMTGVTMGRSL